MAKNGNIKKQAKKPVSKTVAQSAPRLRKLTRRQSRQKTKKDVKNRKPIPGSFKLTWQTLGTLKKFWKPLGGIVLVYLILNIIFASGIGSISSTVSNIKTDLKSGGSLSAAVSGFSSLVGSAGSGGSSTSSVLQSVLIVLESLVIIWALRQLLAGQNFSVKQAYYQSTTPLIPFLLVILVLIIQLLPITLGTAIVSLVLSSVVSSSAALSFVLSLFFVVLAGWSFYLLSGSIFGLYIVTLPDMQPRQALRSSRNLAKYRRIEILRRVLFLPVFMILLAALIIIPLILLYTPLVVPVFYVLSMLAILFVHTYLYSLYRSLIA